MPVSSCSPLAGMTSADTSAASFDPSFAEADGLAAAAAGWRRSRSALALLSAFLTFVVLTGLTPIEPTQQVVVSFLLINAAHHPAAGRHHRPRSLAGGPGPPARPGGGAAARPDRQPVLGHRGAAGGAGRDRRQRHPRSRPRPAVLGPDARGDPEFADRRPRLSARARPADPRRHPGHGQRHRPRPAAVRPGPRNVSRVADRERRRAQPAGRDADRQGSQHPGNARRPASSRPSRRRRRNSSAMSTRTSRRSRCSRRPITSPPSSGCAPSTTPSSTSRACSIRAWSRSCKQTQASVAEYAADRSRAGSACRSRSR